MPLAVKTSHEETQNSFNRNKTWSFYSSEDPLEDFIDWLLQAFDGTAEVVIYAHNGSR